MDIKIENVDKVVSTINIDIYDIGSPFLQRHIDEYGSMVDFMSDGDSIVIQFLGISIWSSDDDPREWNNELGMYNFGLYDWCKKEIKRLVATFEDIAKME